MRTGHLACLPAALLAVALTGCIRPQNYHPAVSTFTYQYRNDGYFYGDRVHEAYIEFDARGMQFDPKQTERALDLITALRHPAGRSEQAVSVFVFVHGWKNNASEDSGNVWGFRRMLDHIANSIHTRGTGDQTTPVVGIYIGWPGAATRSGTFLSFWSRESVANAVGAGELSDVLKRVLVATKDANYSGKSDAVLIGHSFGGLVLERAVVRILEEQLAQLSSAVELQPAADFILLLNEAGPASQAQRFLLQLLRNHIEFSEGDRPFPLVASMTSVGDPATKVAFPGSQFVSPNRPATVNFQPLDDFGQKTTLPYSLLTAANMVALQSHQFHQVKARTECAAGDVFVPLYLRGKQNDANGINAYDMYCIQKKTSPPPQPPIDNTTPYWIMQLPQVFVPDHGSVFRDPVIDMINAFLAHRGRVTLAPAQGKESAKVAALPPPRALAAEVPRRHEPRLRKRTGQ